MRIFIFLILSSVSLLGADSGIKVVTTSKTNVESGSVTTKDVFTRNGQTNLLRDTSSKSGEIRIRIHRFYHAGLLIGDFIATPESSGFTSKAGSPYSLSFEFGPNNEVRTAGIGKDGVILDAFIATNGVFYPADFSTIQKANGVGSDVKLIFSPDKITNTSPETLRREIDDLIEKHKDK